MAIAGDYGEGVIYTYRTDSGWSVPEYIDPVPGSSYGYYAVVLGFGADGTAYVVYGGFGPYWVYRLFANDTFPSWGFSIKHGATSIWERWDGWTPDKGFQDPGMNSFAHYSFGAVGQWMFENIAGINSDTPGFKRIIIRPRIGGGLTYAKTNYNSIRGPVATNWRLKGGDLLLDVTIPANTAATVYIPAAGQDKVTESNLPATDADGVRFVGMEQGTAVYKVGSGTYSFISKDAKAALAL